MMMMAMMMMMMMKTMPLRYVEVMTDFGSGFVRTEFDGRGHPAGPKILLVEGTTSAGESGLPCPDQIHYAYLCGILSDHQ